MCIDYLIQYIINRCNVCGSDISVGFIACSNGGCAHSCEQRCHAGIVQTYCQGVRVRTCVLTLMCLMCADYCDVSQHIVELKFPFYCPTYITHSRAVDCSYKFENVAKNMLDHIATCLYVKLPADRGSIPFNVLLHSIYFNISFSIA
jgi:hypothetical protein